MKQNKPYSRVSVAGLAALFIVGVLLLCTAAGDNQLEAAFRQTYAYQTYLRNDAIRVDLKDGVVVLTGSVAEESHKTLAQAIAANLAGDARVDDQLTVEAQFTDVDPDVYIARKVRLALHFHSNIDEGRIYVLVKDGVVTLQGEAASAAQRQMLAGFIADLAGVRRVQNDMTVAATEAETGYAPAASADYGTREPVDDASVTAQILTTLQTHQSTHAIPAKVATRNGEVTLTGTVSNEAQSAQIVGLVAAIRGVTSINNQLTIKTVISP